MVINWNLILKTLWLKLRHWILKIQYHYSIRSNEFLFLFLFFFHFFLSSISYIFLFFQLLYLLVHALRTMLYFKLGGVRFFIFKKKSMLSFSCDMQVKKNQVRSQLMSTSIRHSSLKKKGSNSFLIFILFFSFFFYIEDNVKLNFRYLIMLNAWDDHACLKKKKTCNRMWMRLV